MTGKEMLGNLKTENLVEFAGDHGLAGNIDSDALKEASRLVVLTFVEPVSFSPDLKHK
jgi:hypothetical protein